MAMTSVLKYLKLIDDIVSIYQTLAKIPAVNHAGILNNGSTIISKWSERNLERNTNTKIMFTQLIDAELNIVSESPYGIDISDEIISSISPRENIKAVFRNVKDPESTNQYLEIWKKQRMTQCIKLEALKIHGNVYADSEFGSLNWNNAENKIVYIAERDPIISEAFCKRNAIKSNNKDIILPGNEYEYKPDWGEQLVNKRFSSIVIYETNTEIFTVVDWIPNTYCPGQVIWSPDDSSIVGVAWETEPRRFGLMYCTNRTSYIFTTTQTEGWRIISEKGKAVRSPRFSNDGKHLIWLQRDIPGPHHSCQQLVKIAWPPTEDPIIEVVIDTIETEMIIEGNKKFTGIYSQGIVKRSFANDGKRMILSTPQKTEARTYVVDTETKKITDISDESFACSTIVLDVHQDLILVMRSSLKQPAQLIMAKLPAAGDEQNIKWIPLDAHPSPINEEIASAKLEYMELEHGNVNDDTNKFSAIFFGNTTSADKPLIVWPHGGPHSSFINSYSFEAALFCSLGFSMVQVNYRGSTGAGQKSLMYLPGKVGSADVEDCVLATDEGIKRYSLHAGKCVLLGSSHGGFLIAHLSGQYPDKYKAAVVRNPVIDIVSKLNTTDTPDGTVYNVGLNYNEVGPAEIGDLLKMRNASPLLYAHNVKAPTLLCLGSVDKRVSYHQGVEYYHKLRANGCQAKILLYEDNHILFKTDVEMDRMINSVVWFLRYVK